MKYAIVICGLGLGDHVTHLFHDRLDALSVTVLSATMLHGAPALHLLVWSTTGGDGQPAYVWSGWWCFL